MQTLTSDLATFAVPPIVQVDGIYVTQLSPNGQVRKDAKGRFKRCILVALGI